MSDLILEAAVLDFSNHTVKEQDGLSVTKTHIETPAQAAQLGRRQGMYVTIQDKTALQHTKKSVKIIKILKNELMQMLPKRGSLLVVGLGNYGMTADALGRAVCQRLDVGEKILALAPSVSAKTGIESYDIIKGVTDRIKPAAVLAVDALATRDEARLCSSIQITSAGIQPGSGVGNHKQHLCLHTLGVPVIGIGVPLILKGAFSSGLMVTVKDIDLSVEAAAQIISNAVNKLE